MTPTTWELLVAFGLRFRAVAAGNRRAARGFRYYSLRREAFFVVLVATMYSVMPLQEVPNPHQFDIPLQVAVYEREEKRDVQSYLPSSEAHVAGEAFERLHIGICSLPAVSPMLLEAW